MMGKGKPDLAILIGKPKGKGREPEDEEMDDMEDEGEEEEGSDTLALAEDVLSAMKDEDAEALDMALRAFYEACC